MQMLSALTRCRDTAFVQSCHWRIDTFRR